MQSSSSTYPCPYCKAKRPQKCCQWPKAEAKTFKSLIIDQKAWVEQSKSNISLLKNHFSVKNQPSLRSNLDEKVINLFPPGPLHLVILGALNKVYGELRSLVNLEQFEKQFI